jgi:hypothetical protein
MLCWPMPMLAVRGPLPPAPPATRSGRQLPPAPAPGGSPGGVNMFGGGGFDGRSHDSTRRPGGGGRRKQPSRGGGGSGDGGTVASARAERERRRTERAQQESAAARSAAAATIQRRCRAFLALRALRAEMRPTWDAELAALPAHSSAEQLFGVCGRLLLFCAPPPPPPPSPCAVDTPAPAECWVVAEPASDPRLLSSGCVVMCTRPGPLTSARDLRR